MDTSNIDIKSVIDQLCCVAWKKPVKSRGEIVYKGGPCPFCHQGTDRFAVFPDGEKPHFYCGINGNGCGAHGDVITFVQLIKGYSGQGPAIRDLQEMGFQIGDGNGTIPFRTRLSERGRPVQKWQDRGNAVVHAAQRGLWSPVGKEALDYLHGRGLTDETIQHFRLGYWPKWVEYKLSDWGLEGDGTFWIRPSILIPCYAKDVLWGINQRITEYTSKERGQMAQGKQLPRYRRVRGSGNGLFNVDAIRAGEPLFVTEGEMDAMTITQETGYSAVATGSTQGAKVSRWTVSLSVASRLLIAFDNDGGKGEEAAKYWTETIFPHKAFYYQPWGKDVNEMLQCGQDLKLWASMGIELASRPTIVESPVQEERGDNGQGQAAAPTSRPAFPVDDGEGQVAALTSLPIDPLDDPVVQEVVRLFNAEVREVIATSDWPRRKAEILEEYQAKRKQEVSQRPDFWTTLREKRSRSDPTKPVDWTHHGYKRDATGKWYMPRNKRFKDIKFEEG